MASTPETEDSLNGSLIPEEGFSISVMVIKSEGAVLVFAASGRISACECGSGGRTDWQSVLDDRFISLPPVGPLIAYRVVVGRGTAPRAAFEAPPMHAPAAAG